MAVCVLLRVVLLLLMLAVLKLRFMMFVVVHVLMDMFSLSLFFLVGVAVLGLFVYLFLRNVLRLRLWFIAVLSVCAVGLLLHFADFPVPMLTSGMF